MTVELEIRPATPDELRLFIKLELRPFGRHGSEGFFWGEERIQDPERTLAAMIDGEIVGSTSSHLFEMATPGGSLAGAGVCSVGVSPTHRRQGITTRLMKRQLSDVHERGESVCLLWASESAIFGRFGYGMACLVENWTIARPHTAFDRSPAPTGRGIFVETEEAMRTFPTVYDRVWSSRPGMLKRGEVLWDLRFLDLEEYRHGADPFFHVAYEAGGRVDGYVIYRVNWYERYFEVMELLAATDEAHAALWRFCFDHDVVETVKAVRQPIDDPVLWMLADPRRLVRTPRDGIWVRLVDVSAALSGRRYGVDGRLVLEVEDSFCEWNQGRVELVGGPAGAECRSTTAKPDLTLSAADLAAVYLGGVRLSTLFRAGRVQAEGPAVLALADSMFTSERQPWCGDHF